MQNAKRILCAAVFVAGSILLNLGGWALAQALEWPFWLDSLGTALVAYAFGPVCGAIVGAAAGVIRAFWHPELAAYALVGVAVGSAAGFAARKKCFESLFGTLSASFATSLIVTAIAVPLNVSLSDGYTGNKWGNGVIDMLAENNASLWICYVIGEYYVAFADLLLTFVVLALLVRAVRRLRDKAQKAKKQKLAGLFSLFCASLVVFGVCGAPKVQAASTEDYSTYLQTVYDNENGLPGGTANDIAQTDDGALWIGTYGGLYRYNGSRFEWMNGFDNVKNVNCLYVDDEGRLWIGTNDSGLSICINDEISNTLDESGGLPSSVVCCIAANKADGYYVGTSSSLAIVSLSNGLRVTATIPEVSYATSVSVGPQGYAAAVTEAGTLYLLDGTEILAQATCPLEGESFTCCYFAPGGTLYTGTSGGNVLVYSVYGGALNFRRSVACESITSIKSLTMSDEGQLILCADNGAGYLDTAEKFHEINTDKFNSSIDNAIFDYQGNLWFTSSRLGLMKLNRSAFTELYSKIWLKASVVNAITQWQGNFYFGTDDGLDMANSSVSTALESPLTQELEGTRIRCLLVDSAGRLWICTSGRGAWCVNTDGSYTVYTDTNGALGSRFRSVIELQDGSILLTGDSGLTCIKDGKVVYTIGEGDGLENQRVLCAYEQSDGSILAGTNGGGISVVRDGKIEKTLHKADGLCSQIIMRIVADPEGEGVFIVTGSGLCFMDNEGAIRTLDNFPYYNNYDVIAAQDGTLFVTCSAGVYVVSRDELLAGGEVSYTLLNAQRGLRSSLTANSWNYVDAKGELYLACNTGVTTVSTLSYNSSYRSYRLALRAVQVDDESYSIKQGEAFVIPSGSKRIVIEPEVMNYSTSDPHVRFCLEGFDEAPRTVALSELADVVYTNLPTGSYVFRLAVLDDTGATVTEASYKIIKEAEIYEHGWFLFYVFAVFTVTLIYIAWLLFRTQLKKTLDLQRRELALAQQQVEMGNEAILTIARTVDARNPSTGQHSFRVAEYSVLIAQRLGFTPKEREELRRAALLHDIGKVGIPDSILNKPARLTAEEYELMKSHVVKGGEILKNFSFVDHIVEGALYHHERYDGTGYMQGLKGDEIPLYARIIGIADSFDAMTSARIYKDREGMEYVTGELRRGRGTQFDPHLTDIMLQLIDEGDINVDEMYRRSQEYLQEGSKL